MERSRRGEQRQREHCVSPGQLKHLEFFLCSALLDLLLRTDLTHRI